MSKEKYVLQQAVKNLAHFSYSFLVVVFRKNACSTGWDKRRPHAARLQKERGIPLLCNKGVAAKDTGVLVPPQLPGRSHRKQKKGINPNSFGLLVIPSYGRSP